MIGLSMAQLPVLGDWVYGLVLKAVSAPQGNPFGRGLSVRKSVRTGATRVPSAEFPFVVVCDNEAAIVLIAPDMAETRPMLISSSK
jgi:hypothetical protein